jgi:hypothetical protein
MHGILLPPHMPTKGVMILADTVALHFVPLNWVFAVCSNIVPLQRTLLGHNCQFYNPVISTGGIKFIVVPPR